MSKFTFDWFPRAVFENALRHVRGTSGLRILEVGTFEGRGALYFLEEFMGPGGALTCVDPFVCIPDPPSVKARFFENTRTHTGRFTLIEERSALALPKLASAAFDLVFVDGDHHRAAVAFDAAEGFRVTRLGGHIVFDDYLWCTESGYSPDMRPKEAIDDFIRAYAGRISVLLKSECVVVKKIAN